MTIELNINMTPNDESWVWDMYKNQSEDQSHFEPIHVPWPEDVRPQQSFQSLLSEMNRELVRATGIPGDLLHQMKHRSQGLSMLAMSKIQMGIMESYWEEERRRLKEQAINPIVDLAGQLIIKQLKTKEAIILGFLKGWKECQSEQLELTLAKTVTPQWWWSWEETVKVKWKSSTDQKSWNIRNPLFNPLLTNGISFPPSTGQNSFVRKA